MAGGSITKVSALLLAATVALLGCKPVEGGRADQAAHPKNPPASSNQNKVKIETGEGKLAGKTCWESQIGKKKKFKGHIYVCVQKKDKKTKKPIGLPYWQG